MGLHKISAIEVYIICCTNRFPLSHKGGEGQFWEGGVGGRGMCLYKKLKCAVCKSVVCECWCDVSVMRVY